jgi:hypothetical protein
MYVDNLAEIIGVLEILFQSDAEVALADCAIIITGSRDEAGRSTYWTLRDGRLSRANLPQSTRVKDPGTATSTAIAMRPT